MATTLGTNGRSLVRAVACGKHDDNGKRQIVLVLLMREPAVYGQQRIESAIRGEAEQSSISGACPPHLRDCSNIVGGGKGRP